MLIASERRQEGDQAAWTAGRPGARFAVLCLVLLLHLGLWLFLAFPKQGDPPVPSSRALTIILQPAPRPPVPPAPRLPISLQQPPTSPSLLPSLDLRALLPPVRHPARKHGPAPVVGQGARSLPLTRTGSASSSVPGRGHEDGTGRQPCLPCVWAWEQRLVARIQDVILSPRLPMQVDTSIRVHLFMTRTGVLVKAELVDRSPSGVLNREAIAAAQRASPLPAAPVDVEGDPVELIVPIHFVIHQR